MSKSKNRAGSQKPSTSAGGILTWIPFWLLLALPALVVIPTAKDAFRAPKLLVSEWLAILTLLPCIYLLRTRKSRVPWRHPAIHLVLPLALAALFSGLGCRFPWHFSDAMTSLLIALLALLIWSLALTRDELWKLLRLLTLPATALAILGILQFHQLYQPFQFQGRAIERLAVTSLAGSAGDLASYLLLPALISQLAWKRSRGGARIRWGLVALLLAYAILATQTLSAIVALAISSAVLWWQLLTRRPRLVATLAVLFVGLGALGLPPIKERLESKAQLVAAGDWNGLLTGRLDGWQVAAWLARSHPANGVGHGAFRPEYVDARLTLAAHGTKFYPEQHQVVFANAHNEYLEVAAEWGIPGVLALFWGATVILRTARKRGRDGTRKEHQAKEDSARTWAGLTAIAVLSLVSFPFRVGLVAYPLVLFLAWLLAFEEESS